MAHRSSYWNCSEFADKLRGTPKPDMGTSEEWGTWHETATKAHPVRYWLAETGLNAVQDFIHWPMDKLYDFKYYINNRFITRTHSLTAHPRDIKPGNWRDVGNRFLPCLFNELQDFVEVELAGHHVAWGGEELRKKYKAPFWSSGWFKLRTWRCPGAGIDNLNWQMSLVAGEDWGLKPGDEGYGEPTDQAKSAKEINELYTWWVYIYRGRPDPYEASGWTAVCEKARELNGGKLSPETPPELKKEHDKAFKLLRKIEKAYETEDEKMLIRLIKVRHRLWT